LRILKLNGKLIFTFEDIAQLESRPLSTKVFHFYRKVKKIWLSLKM
jgi:hypothetical protein